MTVEVVGNETIKVKPCVFQENSNYEKGLDGLLGIFKFFLFTYFQYLFIYLLTWSSKIIARTRKYLVHKTFEKLSGQKIEN